VKTKQGIFRVQKQKCHKCGTHKQLKASNLTLGEYPGYILTITGCWCLLHGGLVCKLCPYDDVCARKGETWERR
jgi:hypothetical protein